MMVISAARILPCELDPFIFYHLWLIVNSGMRTSEKYPQKHPYHLTKKITKMNSNEYIEPVIYAEEWL
jgi:hypothetical protein